MKKSILGTIIILFLSQWLCLAQKKQAFPLKVGAAKVDVTPNNEPTLPATGKYDHERAYVRAIVLDNGATRAALISLEGSGLDDLSWASLYKQLTNELKCPVENIIIAMSHSHSVGDVRPPAGETNPLSPLVGNVMGAVRKAKAKLQPARMGFGKGMSYLNVSRDAIDYDTRKWTQAANLDGWSDKSVDVIKFETPDGKPIAVYMNYGIHPINAYALNVFSGDIPGAACRYIEKAFNDDIIVGFSQGSVGDQNPLYLRPSTNAMASRGDLKITGYELNREKAEGSLRVGDNAKPVDAKVLDNLFRFIESEGQILGEEVIRIMTVTRKSTEDVYIAGQERVVNCPGRKRINGDKMGAAREGVEGVYEDAPDVSMKLGTLGLGTIAILHADGEIFSYIGLRLKSESPLTNTMVVSFANLGRGKGYYIPYDAAYGFQTMEVLDSPIKEGYAEQSIVNNMIEMVTEYLGK